MAKSKKNTVKAVEDEKLEVKAEEVQAVEPAEVSKEHAAAVVYAEAVLAAAAVELKSKHKPDEVVTVPFYFPRR